MNFTICITNCEIRKSKPVWTSRTSELVACACFVSALEISTAWPRCYPCHPPHAHSSTEETIILSITEGVKTKSWVSFQGWASHTLRLLSKAFGCSLEYQGFGLWYSGRGRGWEGTRAVVPTNCKVPDAICNSSSTAMCDSSKHFQLIDCSCAFLCCTPDRDQRFEETSEDRRTKQKIRDVSEHDRKETHVQQSCAK